MKTIPPSIRRTLTRKLWRSLTATERQQAYKHIVECDAIFDGNAVRSDREYAYHQMRKLCIELIELRYE